MAKGLPGVPKSAEHRQKLSIAARTRWTRPERFWSKVDIKGPDECWPWVGKLDDAGYGKIMYGGRHWSAHVLAWVLTNGAWPTGKIGCHNCDNPPCCNPAHTYPGTWASNMADKVARGRAAYQGQQQPDWLVLKRADALRGKPKSDEHRRRLSAAKQGWQPNPELAEKLRAANERRRQNANR